MVGEFKEPPSGAKARVHFAQFTARLKSSPFKANACPFKANPAALRQTPAHLKAKPGWTTVEPEAKWREDA